MAQARQHSAVRGGTHVQENPDRQPRRNRLPRHQDRPQDGHQNRRRLLRGGPGRAARRTGRRGRTHRPAAHRPELSGHGAHRPGLQGHRRRSGASRLRLPVRASGVLRGAGEGRDRVHRPEGERHRRHGRQDHLQETGQESRGQHRARLHRSHQGRQGSRGDRPGASAIR